MASRANSRGCCCCTGFCVCGPYIAPSPFLSPISSDGFARKQGVGCCCTTFCVGGFSLLNAIAGAYAEDLPVIVISAGWVGEWMDHPMRRVWEDLPAIVMSAGWMG